MWLFLCAAVVSSFLTFVTLTLGFGIGHMVGHWQGIQKLTPARMEQEILEMATLKALFDSLKAIKTESQTAKQPIPPHVWKKLIKLAHPDHNDGSLLSTEVTAWLLQHRPE